MIKVTIWNEYYHEKIDDVVNKLYPNGIHMVIKDFLEKDEIFDVKTATLDETDCGLTEDVLNSTDVLIWWGHKKHEDVPDEIARRVIKHVQAGMGFIALHSTHLSKPFLGLMGTSCTLKWRKQGEKERLWNVNPSHPIMSGVPEFFELDNTEMYGEFFDIPIPDQLLCISWFPGGEVFRSACVWRRGNGNIFFLKPGHETFPIFYNK